MFCVALKVANMPHHMRSETIFTKSFGLYFTSILGICGCILSIIVGTLSPDEIIGGDLKHYTMIFISSMIIVMLMPLLFFYRIKNK